MQKSTSWRIEDKPWKKDTLFMTVSCFIAYFLGYYKYTIRKIFLIVMIMAVMYAIIHFTGLSIEFHLGGKNLFMIR